MKISFQEYVCRRIILGVGRIYQIGCSLLVVVVVPGALEYVLKRGGR